MGVAKRPYGPWSKAMLQSLREAGLLKAEAFTVWLRDQDIPIDRTLISHWSAGRSHLPADVLPHLAQFTGRAERVFGPYLRHLGFEPVAVPEGAPEGKELADLLLELSVALGKLQLALVEARSPGGPGGRNITAGEWDVLGRRLDELIHRAADLRVQVSARPPRS